METGEPIINWIMLNPSTADEFKNDPTIERCQRRSVKMRNFGGMIITNIFAYRATNPKELYGLDDPIGEENNFAITAAAEMSTVIVCAWGRHGNLHSRGEFVRMKLLNSFRDRLHYLTLNEDGQPGHPLYVGYKKGLQPMR